MASAEELCESEVLWPEAPPHDDGDATPSCSSTSSSPVAPRSTRTPAARGGVPESERPIRPAGSRPVDIPRPAAARRRDHEDEDGGWSWSGGTMVPPHVLVSRRRSESEGPAAFALRSGPGRARELSHLRNSVLRMTGFIEG